MLRHKTTRRDEIAKFIAAYARIHHNAPSTYEIADHFHIAQQTVCTHILKLIAEGRAIKIDGKLKLIRAEYIPPPVD